METEKLIKEANIAKLIKDLQEKVEKITLDIKNKYMDDFQSAESLVVTATSLKVLHDAIILQFDSDENAIYKVLINSISAEAKIVETKPNTT